MTRRKSIRTRGKVQLSRFFQELEKGEFVSVVREPSMKFNFPERLQGRTGSIESRRGKAYVVKIKDQNKEKKFLIEPIHLKKVSVVAKEKK